MYEIADLISALGDSSVIFEWSGNDYARAAWSQSGDQVRLDFVRLDEGTPAGGRIFVLDEELRASQLCIWARTLQSEEEASVTCTSTGRLYGEGVDAWAVALSARAYRTDSNIDLIGRNAECFRIAVDGVDGGELCVSAGVPLRLKVGDETFEAIEASVGPVHVDIPAPDFEGIVSRGALALPLGLDPVKNP